MVPEGVFLSVEWFLGAIGGQGDNGLLLGAAGDGGLFFSLGVLLDAGLDLVVVGVVVEVFFFSTISLERAFFSFSFSLSLSFFSFFFLSNGVELRRRWRCVMSGVLADTPPLQRSEVFR